MKVRALYKKAIEELGLMQLDVYRVVDPKKKVPKDIVRIYDPTTTKVVTVDLGNIREALKPVEYFTKILDALKEAGIPYPERKANQILEAFRRMSAEEGEAATATPGTS